MQETYVIVRARLSQSKNGPFWDLELQDCTGQIEAKIWHPLSNSYQSFSPSQLVRVKGQVKTFRENLQLNVQELEIIESQEGVNWAEFIPTSSRAPEDLLSELEDLCRKELTYSPWRKLCRKVLKNEVIREKLLKAPAAKSIHHAYLGGLLEHTLNVSKLSLAVSKFYPELDREVLLVAAVLHDLGKAWELEGGVTREYTDEGTLLGHIFLGLQILEPFFQDIEDLDEGLLLHLKHIILSHHGQYAFGSPKRPKTQEALVLHYVDDLDAKMNTVKTILTGQEDEENKWSQYVYSLERRLYKAESTPDRIPQEPQRKKDSFSFQGKLPGVKKDPGSG